MNNFVDSLGAILLVCTVEVLNVGHAAGAKIPSSGCAGRTSCSSFNALSDSNGSFPDMETRRGGRRQDLRVGVRRSPLRLAIDDQVPLTYRRSFLCHSSRPPAPRPIAWPRALGGKGKR